MHAPKWFAILLFLMIFPALGTVHSLSAAEAPIAVVNVSQKSEVNRDRFYLGDISVMNGSDPGLIHRLKDVLLGRCPLPGQSRRIDEGRIWVRLKQFDIDTSRVRLNVPDNAEVNRGYRVVSKEKLRNLIRSYLHQLVSWNEDTMHLKAIQIREDVVLPKGPMAFQIEIPKGRDFCGKVPVSVNIRVGDELREKVWAVADIEVMTKVIVAKRPLRRYREITEDDIEVREMPMSRLPSKFLSNFGEVLGKRTSRSIDVNTVLRSDLIEFPPLVKRGDVVTVVAESPGLRITAVGVVKAREGRRGDRVRVENIDSKKCIYAQVMDAKTVRVEF
jgi:flagellar basal body P-ring formation protein FlgA